MLNNIDLNKYDVISFDIFDTLIKRACFEPKEIFKFVGKHFSNSGFYQKRIDAEKKARDIVTDEVTLDDIYSQLSLNSKEKYKEYEMQTEVALCHANSEVVTFLHKCKDSNKIVLIISDIYLPRRIIENILENNQIIYDALYVSSEKMCTKESGKLFDLAQNELKLNKKRWLHIGDNKKSDFLIPHFKGINTIHIEKDDSGKIYFVPDNISGIVETEDYKNIYAFCRANEKSTTDYFYHIGYEAQGPLLYGFIKWLSEKLEEDGIEKVFFLARDGMIMQKAYHESGLNSIHDVYMFGSRRALIVPTLYFDNSLRNVRKSIFWPRIGTIDAFLDSVGLSPEASKNDILRYGFKPGQVYQYENLFEDSGFQSFFESIREEIKNNAEREYFAILKYLQKISFTGKVGIVDIGWNGNMQKALQKVAEVSGLDVDIHGYYIGLNPESINVRQNLINAKGYLFSQDHNAEMFYQERTFNSIFEMLFTADHGTTKYFYDDGKVKLADFEYSDEKLIEDYKKISTVQEAAIQFVKDKSRQKEFECDFTPEDVFKNFRKIGTSPNLKDAKYFGDMHMLGDSIVSIAEPNKMFTYLRRPHRLKTDLELSSWRIGFAKRLFKINLPYYDIYYKLRNHCCSFNSEAKP